MNDLNNIKQEKIVKYSAVILGGGKSTRMGSDKGSLLINGKSFIETIAGNLADADELFLSTGENELYKLPGIRNIRDEYKDIGPVAGIHKALKSMKNEWLFAVACDMPFIDSAFAGQLLKNGLEENEEAVLIVPRDKSGRYNMLGAMYHRSLYEKVTELINGGERKLRRIMELSGDKLVVTDITEERFLRNINTKEEYEALLAKNFREV